MPHQCTRCSTIYQDAAEEILKGCNCGSRFFYYIRQEKLDSLKRETKEVMIELEKADKDQIEQDIRELTGITKPDDPVILDLESVKVIKPGKFEIDIVNLFAKNRPLIYKLGEGKYIIDLASSLKIDPKYKKKQEIFKIEKAKPKKNIKSDISKEETSNIIKKEVEELDKNQENEELEEDKEFEENGIGESEDEMEEESEEKIKDKTNKQKIESDKKYEQSKPDKESERILE